MRNSNAPSGTDGAGSGARSGRALAMLLLAGAALLAGCASAPQRAEDWPASLPPRAYYVAIHDADARNGEVEPLGEYLTWVTRFYNGWGPFPHGWDAMSEAALHSLPPGRREVVLEKLAYLGQLISGEWAKARSRTRIPNRVLAAWAQAMSEAVARGEVEMLLDRATADVEALLAGDLDAGEVRVERYFPDLDLDLELDLEA